MRRQEIEARIAKLCAGFILRARENTKQLSRWPEEGSPFQKVLATINDLERRNANLESNLRKREKNSGAQTRVILAQAFQSAIHNLATPDEREPEEIEPLEDPFVFCGKIFKVNEVLQFLADNQRSGEIRIEAEEETFVIEVSKGEVINARSTNSPKGKRLGEILVDRFGVERMEIENFVARFEGSEKIGKALIQEELVSRTIVYEALRYQMVEMFERCMSTRGLDILFDPSAMNSENDTGPAINLGDLLLEGILG